jgi:hypothetical protein
MLGDLVAQVLAQPRFNMRLLKAQPFQMSHCPTHAAKTAIEARANPDLRQ